MISTVLIAALAGTGSFIWAHSDTIAGGSKSVWNLLKYPFQMQAWIAILGIIGVIWIYHLFAVRKLNQLRAEFEKHKAQDPRFIAAFNFVIDENVKSLKHIIAETIGTPDKAIPFILNANTFKEFWIYAGIKLVIDDNLEINEEVAKKGGASSFWVPNLDDPIGPNQLAKAAMQRGKCVTMNNVAYLYYDWAYFSFKKTIEKNGGLKAGKSTS